jgi:hypothetical protein
MTVMAWLPCSHGAHWRGSGWLAQMFLRGNTTQAKAAYQEFPALWKDA